jgi:hypothetical protein
MKNELKIMQSLTRIRKRPILVIDKSPEEKSQFKTKA